MYSLRLGTVFSRLADVTVACAEFRNWLQVSEKENAMLMKIVAAFGLMLVSGIAAAQPQVNREIVLNRQLLRGSSVFDSHFDLNANGPNPVNSYLAIYLTTLVYPEFLDQLTGSQLKQNTSYTASMHTTPTFFYDEFVLRTRHLFTDPTFTWVYGTSKDLIRRQWSFPHQKRSSSSFAERIVLDQRPAALAEALSSGGRMKADFKFHQINPDLPTLGDVRQLSGETKVHAGFWKA